MRHWRHYGGDGNTQDSRKNDSIGSSTLPLALMSLVIFLRTLNTFGSRCCCFSSSSTLWCSLTTYMFFRWISRCCWCSFWRWTRFSLSVLHVDGWQKRRWVSICIRIRYFGNTGPTSVKEKLGPKTGSYLPPQLSSSLVHCAFVAKNTNKTHVRAKLCWIMPRSWGLFINDIT